jgi:exodeoxyribonuclease III
VRIATWNINSLRARQERVEEWVADVQPDVLLLQETKLADDAFPALAFSALGYDSAHYGQGQWNGVAILSKVGLDDVVTNFAGDTDPDPDARIITATCGGVRVSSVYVPERTRTRRRPLHLQAVVARPARHPPPFRHRSGAGRDRRR